MLNEAGIDRVYLACGPTDSRKSIDGLAVLVRERFQLDPFTSCLFVFCNRQRDKLKILQWEHNGFWLHYRRLEKGKFQWPSKTSSGVVTKIAGVRAEHCGSIPPTPVTPCLGRISAELKSFD